MEKVTLKILGVLQTRTELVHGWMFFGLVKISFKILK
jgi:hypothetical protein